MHHEHYVTLLEGFCRLTGMDLTESLLADGQFCLDEVDFTLDYGGVTAPASVLIYCDFGPVGELNVSSCMELLGRNLLLYDGEHTAAFAVSPESGRILLMTSADLFHTTAAALLEQLEYCAQLSTQWRDGTWTTIEDEYKEAGNG